MARILIAPLDWGLGHATRCIPLVRHLLLRGCTVVLAAEGPVATLLQQEFPQLPLLPLPGYRVSYGRGSARLSVLLQLPRILLAMRRERRWLRQLLKREQFDAVISDNRPGLHHPAITSIYITHQLRIRSGLGAFFDGLLERLHARAVRSFDETWIPDATGPLALAGSLSKPANWPQPLRYLGLLSRFELPAELPHRYDLLLLLSGPEPQRTRLEQLFCGQLASYAGKVLLVRGLPQTASPLPAWAPSVTVVNHLPAQELQQALLQCGLVVSRSGYTTLMDLLRLRRPAVLVPTPGQTEQEYLAVRMQELGFFPWLPQKNLQLQTVLAAADHFTASPPPAPEVFEHYRSILDAFLSAQGLPCTPTA